MITVSLYGRLGNHLWQYAVCRTIAEKKGYEFHIPINFDNRFNCDLGVKIPIIKNHYPYEGCFDFIQRYDPKIFDIPDFTKIHGFFQCEKYIIENRKQILQWFKSPENLQLLEKIQLDDNTCVINFRGGDYALIPHVFLDKKYYKDSIKKMLEINPQMNFIIVTDDINLAKKFFPNYRIYHEGVMEDYTLVNKANYLIIVNSTFSWWAAWLNTRVKFIIAPKYWLRHNKIKGPGEWGDYWWAPSDSLTSRFHYIDREGKLFSYSDCLKEISEYNYMDHYKPLK